MGVLEERGRKRRRRDNIQNAVLAAIGTAGILAVAAVAPNVFQALPHIMGKRQYKLKFQTKTATGRLIAKGYVKRGEKGFLEITSAGVRHLEIKRAQALAPAKTKRRWDKRYRLVMFDIPEYRRKTRSRLRALMNDFGFLRLQDSVWVSPYDCEDLISLVKAELKVGKDILYAVVDQIENDSWIKKHFGLGK